MRVGDILREVQSNNWTDELAKVYLFCWKTEIWMKIQSRNRVVMSRVQCLQMIVHKLIMNEQSTDG